MDKYLLPGKSSSETNLTKENMETTPPNYVLLRGKRGRTDDWEADFGSFKEEMKEMIGTLMAKQETEIKRFFNPTLLEIQKTNLNIENSIALLMSKNEELTKRVEQLEIEKKKGL